MLFLYCSALFAFNRLRELENQLSTLEASKPSAPPALQFKVRITVVCSKHNTSVNIVVLLLLSIDKETFVLLMDVLCSNVIRLQLYMYKYYM